MMTSKEREWKPGDILTTQEIRINAVLFLTESVPLYGAGNHTKGLQLQGGIKKMVSFDDCVEGHLWMRKTIKA